MPKVARDKCSTDGGNKRNEIPKVASNHLVSMQLLLSKPFDKHSIDEKRKKTILEETINKVEIEPCFRKRNN